MEIKQSKVSLKGTWKQALGTFFFPILLFLILRWAVVEPFVIPSESMVPNLLIHDHILVFKSSFGLKLPFSDKWIAKWSQPEVGDIVVFKYPINPNLYYVKRIIGRPGDRLKIANGRIEHNNEIATYSEQKTNNQFIENLNGRKHFVQFQFSKNDVKLNQKYEQDELANNELEVPKDMYFVMGDNRDASSDSRIWGFVPKQNLIGKTWIIWLSCEETLTDVEFLCDPLKLRWERIFKKVDADL